MIVKGGGRPEKQTANVRGEGRQWREGVYVRKSGSEGQRGGDENERGRSKRIHTERDLVQS